jgi:hypothetical protein
MEKSEILPDFITDFNNVEGKCWGVFGDENDLNDEIGVPMLKQYEKTLVDFYHDCDNYIDNDHDFKLLFG